MHTRQVGDILRYIDITDIIKTAVRAKLPEIEIDVADLATLKDRIRKRAELDAIYAF